MKNYNNLFTVVKTIYGLDLNKDNFDSLEPKEGSLLKKAELKDINKILTSLVEKTITNQLKKELTIPQEKFDEIKGLKVNVEELNKVVGELRKTTKDLSNNLGAVISETEKVSKTLEEKPEFKDTEKRDNTELVTVSMDINKDLIKLMTASNTLLNNTKSNQSTSETINKGFENLGNFVRLDIDGEKFDSKTVLIATGNSYRMLGLPREEEFFGRGVHTCATCDGPFYAGKDLIAVGGGNSAVTEALFLSRFSKVKLLVRGEISAQAVLQERLFEAVKSGKIELFLKTEIEEFIFEKTDFGEKIIGALIKQQTEEGEKTFEIKAAAIFEFIGLIPNSSFAKKSGVEVNSYGEIVVNNSFETNISRVYASGDIIENAQKQIVVAAATGAQAAIKISEFLHNEK